MTTAAKREPTFMDYVSAAFHLKVTVPGLGGLPLNYLYLALGAGLSVAAWPVSMFFAAGELAYIVGLASHPRFQTIVKSRVKQANGISLDDQIQEQARHLSYYGSDFRAFCEKCDQVVRIADQVLGPDSDDLLHTYQTNLQQLRAMYVRILRMRESLEAHFDADADVTIQKQIDTVQKQIDDPNQPDVTKASEQRTVEILNKRLETHKQLEDQLSSIGSQVREMDERLELIHDQVLLSRSPEALAQNVQVASDVMEQQSEWLRQHGDMFEQMQVMQQR